MSHRPLQGDDGVTLVELLVAIVILGIAFTALLGGMATGVIGSRHHRSQSSANTILVSAAEKVKAAAYVACAVHTDYDPAAALAEVTGDFGPADVTAVQYWDGAADAFGATCPAGGDQKLQQVTVSVANGDTTETLSFVKRNPAVT